MAAMRWQPALRTLPAYHDDAHYIDALEADITRQLAAQGWQAIRFFPVGQKSRDIFEPRESIGKTAKFLIRAREELGDEVVLGTKGESALRIAVPAAKDATAAQVT